MKQFERAGLADFASLLIIAKHRSFRHAPAESELSDSALTHAKRPETRTGVRLLNRMQRSVTRGDLYTELSQF